MIFPGNAVHICALLDSILSSLISSLLSILPHICWLSLLSGTEADEDVFQFCAPWLNLVVDLQLKP